MAALDELDAAIADLRNTVPQAADVATRLTELVARARQEQSSEPTASPVPTPAPEPAPAPETPTPDATPVTTASAPTALGGNG